MSLLRRVRSQQAVDTLWQEARANHGSTKLECPDCCQPMHEIVVPGARPALRLDVCTCCQFIWFDPHELAQFPAPDATASKPLPEKAREAIAMQQVRRVAEEAEKAAYKDPGPEEPWQWIPGLFGLPVEEDAPDVKGWPWLTYGLAAVLVLVYAVTATNLRFVIDQYGLVPAELWRHGGVTPITSFFLHGGLLHLIGNVYFLIVFGDNVEDDLGVWPYVVLLVAAALFGDLLHVLGNLHSSVPCVGASGGISGVITYYALRFPRARLGYMFWFWWYIRWVHVPAYAALVFWFAIQFLLVIQQQMGVGNVAALAHLGGAAVGVGAWLLWRAGQPQQSGAV